MNNEELRARAAALNSLEDAYQLAQEGGYTGSVADFIALGEKLAAQAERMDMDAMDSVAGGGVVDDVVDWCSNNKALTIEIVTGTVAVIATAAIAYNIGHRRGNAEGIQYNNEYYNN